MWSDLSQSVWPCCPFWSEIGVLSSHSSSCPHHTLSMPSSINTKTLQMHSLLAREWLLILAANIGTCTCTVHDVAQVHSFVLQYGLN